MGGHCIGVDPYYFVYEAENLGYHSQIIANGRQINDDMGYFIAEKLIKQLIKTGKTPIQAKVAILGLTFKEHTPDVRNSKVVDIVERLEEYGIHPVISDPWAEASEVEATYGLELTAFEDLKDLDAVVVAVAHNEFKTLTLDQVSQLFAASLEPSERVIVDVKSLWNKDDYLEAGYCYWRL